MIDTHCHIHSSDYDLKIEDVIKDASNNNVTKFICVGTNIEDSKNAMTLAQKKSNIWASCGLHPHDSSIEQNDLESIMTLVRERPGKLIAIGECGLDYHYNNSSKKDQIKALEFQIDIALKHNLPIIFHVRDAFDDFWPIFDNFKGIQGVIHSFTANSAVLEEALKRELFIGLNGIVTFTKDKDQLDAIKLIPKNKLVLETDAPFLTPVPLRGKTNQPSNIKLIAECISTIRGDSFEFIAEQSTKNAEELFGI